MLAITSSLILKTKSHEERKVRHTPNEGEGTHDASVSVTEVKGKRIVRVLMDTYLVEEVPADGFSGRQWLILKDNVNGVAADTVKGRADAGRCGNVYECRVFAGGVYGTCSCDAGCTKSGECVHFLMMRSLIAAGLPSPLCNPDTEYDPREVSEPGDEWFLGLPTPVENVVTTDMW